MIEQSEEQPGEFDVEAQLRRDLQARPAPAFTPDLQAVKRRGMRRRRRTQVLPAVLVLAVVGVGAAALGSGVLSGAERGGTVTVVAADAAAGDATRSALTPAWCQEGSSQRGKSQGGSITYDSDGTGLASPELAVQYLIDVSDAKEDHLTKQPESAEVDDALAQNAVVLDALYAVKGEASAMGIDRVRQDGSVVARDENGNVIAQARLVEVQPGQWNVATLSFPAPVMSECGS